MAFDWVKGLPLIGDLIGAASQQRANRENRLMQEKFASQGIRMRVEDAKAAGLHPLFALGASVPGYSPSAQPLFNGAELGQNIGRAASQFSQDERELRAAQLRAINAGAMKDEALAAAAASEMARNAQEQYVSRPPVAQAFPVRPPGWDPAEWAGYVRSGMGPEAESSTMVRHSGQELDPPHPYLVNPTGPAAQSLKRWGFPGVGEILAPAAADFSESLEGVENMLTASAIVYANVVHYKDRPHHLKQVLNFLQERAKQISAQAFSNVKRAIADALPSFAR